ncbi:hypothetical protein KJ762_03705 [bacterium]|nr:hypothetical protein [bacterium]MBU1633598.1 hypothetical protein [bacterium]MBU1872700.1 hypothetical protein [bacterium]
MPEKPLKCILNIAICYFISISKCDYSADGVQITFPVTTKNQFYTHVGNIQGFDWKGNYIAAVRNNDIWLYNTINQQWIQKTDYLSQVKNNICLSWDNAWIMYRIMTDSNDIYIMNITTSEVTKMPINGIHPTMSMDNNRISYIENDLLKVYCLEDHSISVIDSNVTCAEFSPSKNEIMYISKDTLYTWNINQNLNQLKYPLHIYDNKDAPTWYINARWSPNGNYIFWLTEYFYMVDNYFSYYLLSLQDTTVEFINLGIRNTAIRWSNEETKLAYLTIGDIKVLDISDSIY